MTITQSPAFKPLEGTISRLQFLRNPGLRDSITRRVSLTVTRSNNLTAMEKAQLLIKTFQQMPTIAGAPHKRRKGDAGHVVYETGEVRVVSLPSEESSLIHNLGLVALSHIQSPDDTIATRDAAGMALMIRNLAANRGLKLLNSAADDAFEKIVQRMQDADPKGYAEMCDLALHTDKHPSSKLELAVRRLPVRGASHAGKHMHFRHVRVATR